MDDAYTFGSWVKQRRKRLRLTQRELAEQVGYAEITLRKVEADELRPSREMAQRLAGALLVPARAHAQFLRFARDEADMAQTMTPSDHISLPQYLALDYAVPGNMTTAPATVDWGEAPTAPTRHNLPYPATPLVGRQHELAKLDSLLSDTQTRLVTILAPGGMGKTRLALEAARARLDQHADGVFFVPLAHVNDPNAVALAIAEQINIDFYGHDAPQRQLLNYLSRRSLLLILDNFEHLLSAAPFVGAILSSAPDVRIITTSRERLGLQGETVYILRGLDFHTGQNLGRPESSAAASLFLRCASRVRPDFVIQGSDLGSLRRICDLTAGMPLAIELAAGWVNTLSLGHIADELQAGLDILESELRDIAERHRSIRATFDRSWQQLSESDRQVFMCLSVFSGGFSRDAALDVAAADKYCLRRLSNKALIEVSESGRYSIHELLRQFGAEKLAGSQEEAQVQSKYTVFFTRIMRHSSHDYYAGNHIQMLQWIADDFENVRSAWLQLLAAHDWEALGTFIEPIWFFCRARVYYQTGIEFFESAEVAARSVQTTAAAEFFLGRLLARISKFYYAVGLAEKSGSASSEAIHILTKYDSPSDLLHALNGCLELALIRRQTHVVDSTLQQSLALARSIGDRRWEGHLLISAAIAALIQNDLSHAQLLAVEGLAILDSGGDLLDKAAGYDVLGYIREGLGNYEEAATCFQKKIGIATAIGNLNNTSASQAHLARIALHQGDLTTARQHLHSALRIAFGAGQLWQCIFTLVCVAELLTRQEQCQKAVEVLGAVDDHLTAFHMADQIARSARDELATKLEPHDVTTAWERGRQRELSDLIKELLFTVLSEQNQVDSRTLPVSP
ncbi:MAG: helix-turn-helix domain-containing protein [Caldilineaceae bacterium]